MFDISFTEILVISVIALIVIGPEKLPHVARTLGHLFGRGRRYVASIKNDIHNEIELEELKNLRASMQETAQSIEDSVRQEIDQIKSTTDSESIKKTPPPTATSTEIRNDAAYQTKVTDSLAKPAHQQQTPPESNDSKSNAP